MDEDQLKHYGVMGMRWGKSGKRGRSKLGFTPKSNSKPSKITDPLLQKIADQRYDRQRAGKFGAHNPIETINRIFLNQPVKSRTNLQVLLNANLLDVRRAKKALAAEKGSK